MEPDAAIAAGIEGRGDVAQVEKYGFAAPPSGLVDEVVVSTRAIKSDDEQIAVLLNNGHVNFGMKGDENVQRLQKLLGLPEDLQTGNYLGKTQQSVANWKKAQIATSQVSSSSLYAAPISHPVDEPMGRSRRGGDVSPEVKQLAINTIIKDGKTAKMSNREIAVTLAIADQESGFNPDAANKTSSASGLGQFTIGTGRGYGLDSGNRWNLSAQSNALVDLTDQSISTVQSRGYDTSDAELVRYVYKIHHDGSLGAKDTPEYLLSYPKVAAKVPYYLDYVNRVNK